MKKTEGSIRPQFFEDLTVSEEEIDKIKDCYQNDS
jgi:hypothetical protein